MGSKRALATLLALGLTTAACGDRGDTTAKSNDSSGSETSTETSAKADGLPTDYPCGGGTKASGATEKGVSDTTIKIVTIQDVENQAQPGLFLPNRQAMDAFVKMCNDLGGINGRKLELTKLDAGLVNYGVATATACESDVLAMVGTAAALDGDGTPTAEACGIIDIPGLTAELKHGQATNVVQPLPFPGKSVNAFADKYLLELTKENEDKSVGGLFSNRPVTNRVGRMHMLAFDKLGAKTSSPQLMADIGANNWGPFLDSLKDSRMIYVVGAPDASGSFLQAAYDAGIKLPPVLGDQSLYNQVWLDAHKDAAEGVVYTPVTTCFLEEEATCPELQRFHKALEAAGFSDPPTALGIQTWSSALLFATAVKALGSDVTRPKLLAELKTITEWDGFGIHGTTNPGGNELQVCVALARVQDGKYVRVTPEEGFECSEENEIETPVSDG